MDIRRTNQHLRPALACPGKSSVCFWCGLAGHFLHNCPRNTEEFWIHSFSDKAEYGFRLLTGYSQVTHRYDLNLQILDPVLLSSSPAKYLCATDYLQVTCDFCRFDPQVQVFCRSPQPSSADHCPQLQVQVYP